MTRLRARALDGGGGGELAERVDRGTRRAALLRGLIGAISIALLALAAVLAT